MGLYSNKHLLEVNCGFQFPNETTEWDSTFFGQFYEKIKNEGFNQKEERKGVQLTFKDSLDNKSTSSPSLITQVVDDVVIFKNNTNGWAISMGKSKVSFHIVSGYESWDLFLNNFIEPFYKKYLDLGLGNGIRNCNLVYLNRFTKESGVVLSEYFSILNQVKTGFGVETSTLLQRVFLNESVLLVTKLNSNTNSNSQVEVSLECGAVCNKAELMNDFDWKNQANITHEPIRDFFESIITEKLRKEL